MVRMSRSPGRFQSELFSMKTSLGETEHKPERGSEKQMFLIMARSSSAKTGTADCLCVITGFMNGDSYVWAVEKGST